MEPKFSSQNNKALAAHSEDFPEGNRLSLPVASICHGLGAVSKTWKSPLIFAKQGAKVNTSVYIDDDILAPALRDMKQNFKNGYFTF